MAKLWKFLSISIVLVVCLGLLLVPAVVGVSAGAGDPPEPGAGNATFLLPAEVEVLAGETFLVNVTIYNPHSVCMSVATAAIRWDNAALLSVNDITLGDWPAFVGQWPTDITTAVDNFSYTAGGSPTDPYRATTITHCIINFTATADGVTTVRFVTDAGEYHDVSSVVYDTSPIPQEVLDWSAMQNMTVKIGAPKLTVNPSSLSFTTNEGKNPPDQTLEVCNLEAGTLNWALTDGDTAWLSETPTSGSLGEGGCEDVTVSVDVTGMEAGDYGAIITITGSAAVEVPVSLHIESAGVPIPVGPANLSASALNISPQQVEPGEEVTISINVANTGGEAGDYDAVLYINGVVEDSQTVSVAGGTSKDVIFTVSKSQSGVYDVSVAGESGQFEVVSGGGLGSGGIIAIVAVVIILIVALVFILRGRRRET